MQSLSSTKRFVHIPSQYYDYMKQNKQKLHSNEEKKTTNELI